MAPADRERSRIRLLLRRRNADPRATMLPCDDDRLRRMGRVTADINEAAIGEVHGFSPHNNIAAALAASVR